MKTVFDTNVLVLNGDSAPRSGVPTRSLHATDAACSAAGHDSDLWLDRTAERGYRVAERCWALGKRPMSVLSVQCVRDDG